MLRYLLDTNTCIMVMKEQSAVTKAFRARSLDTMAVSSITTYELWTGVEKALNREREEPRVTVLLSALSKLEFDEAAAREAAKVRAVLESKGKSIGPYDTLLAGQALALGLTLVTHNGKEFRRVPGLKVEDWAG
jgi:tRNA(fMet)-specific endonuclease VapC